MLLIIALLLAAKFLVEIILEALNRRNVRAAAGEVPEPYRGFIDEPTYDRSVAYTLAKNRMGMWETAYDAMLLALLLFSGVLPLLWAAMEAALGSGILAQSFSVFLIMIAISWLSLPFEWVYQFRLEERFGFNNSTLKLWVSDKIKGLLIGAVLGIPAIAFILWLVSTTELWWILGFVFFAVFQLILVVLYPMFILPLFNKFEPLPEGSLRARLLALGERTGFHAKTILVMDGSRRSAHSNAYFTGFGRFRRIVLYDTLIEQMPERSLEAVLAHEIGHYKRGHLPKLLAISFASLLLTFYVLHLLIQSSWFAPAFGFSAASGMGPILLLFALLSGLVTFWTTPLMNALSRKHEYEADAFAKAAMGDDPQPLQDALRTLNTRNLSNLTPHPVYSAFHYSHPTLLEREAALLRSA